jgi:hypothetical protein
MVLEDLLLVVAIGVLLGFVGWPLYLFAHRLSRRKGDPLAEAHERLRIAQVEAETARVNRETERIYDEMYKETLEPSEPSEPSESGPSSSKSRTSK